MSCPNCGYCPTCGRSNQITYYYPYQNNPYFYGGTYGGPLQTPNTTASTPNEQCKKLEQFMGQVSTTDDVGR